MRIILFALINLATSCGIIQSGEPNYDPEFHKKRLEELNSKKETKEKDSLIRQVESASMLLPKDLIKTTLVVETYDYSGFLDIQTNKFYRPADSKKTRKYFSKYTIKKKSLLKEYKYKVAYADKPEYENLPKNEFRYVLKTTMKINSKDEEIVIYKDGSSAGWVSIRLYYIYDRTTGQVFGEIDKIERLTNL